MEDIQQIISKMESLNKEIAAIINQTKQEDTTINESGEELDVSKTQKCVGGYGDNCPYFKREVDLCCTTVVKHFNVETDSYGNLRGVKLIFDPNCLHAIVEKEKVEICHEKCGEICVYVVKVVGCIPFAFSATNALEDVKVHYGRPDNTCPNEEKVDLCCQGSICVDNNICCYTEKDDAEKARKFIAENLKCPGKDNKGIIIKTGPSASLLKCKGYFTPDGCKEETYVKFTATLEVPNENKVPCPHHPRVNCDDEPKCKEIK